MEFDPAVVTAFLSLPPLEELRSFAKTDELAESPTPNDGLTLLSSFMR